MQLTIKSHPIYVSIVPLDWPLKLDQEIRLFKVSFNVKIQSTMMFKVKYPKVDCDPIRTFVCETH